MATSWRPADHPYTQRKSPPMVSPPVKLPGSLELVTAQGESAQVFVGKPELVTTSFDVLPETEAEKLEAQYQDPSVPPETRVSNARESFTKFYEGAHAVGPVSSEVVTIPLGELHRPQVPGCKAVYDRSFAEAKAFSVEVNVFGVGGGSGVSRQYGFSDKTEVSGPCLSLNLPVEVEWQEFQNSGGQRWYRGTIVGLADDYREDRLEPCTGCHPGPAGFETALNEQKRMDSGDLPAETTVTKSYSVDKGTKVDLTLEPTIGPVVKAGPEAEVKFQQDLQISYELSGGHRFVGFQPEGSPGYRWSWK